MKIREIKKRLVAVLVLSLIFMITVLGASPFFLPKAWAAANSAEYSIEANSTYATNFTGDITTVISAKNNSGLKIFALSFYLNYDKDVFLFVSGELGTALPTGSFNNIEKDGKVILSVENVNQTALTSFQVVKFVFKLKANAPAADYKFRLTECATGTLDNDTNEVPSVVNDKTIKLTAPSTAADLTALTVKNGSTVLVGTWTAGGMTANNSVYTVTSPVGYGVTSIGVTPAVSANATVTVKGAAVASGASKAVDLAVGANSVEVKVTAQDGIKINIFTIKVTRQAGDDSTALQLSVKGAAGADCDVQKDGDIFTVAGVIPFVDADGMKVIPTANALSVIKVAGAVAVTGTEVSLTLKSGKNEIAVTVTSQVGTPKNYTLVVNVSAPNVANTLSELVLTYADGTVIELNTAFSPEILMYFVRVNSDVTAIHVAAKTTDENSVIVSGLGSQNVPGVLEIAVKAQNGDIKTYQIAVVQIIVSEEESIKDVVVNGEEIDFKKDQLHYDVNISGNIDKIDFSYFAGEGVIVEIFGNENLKAGNNTVLLKVEQPNGVTITYTFSVHKPDNAKTLYLLLSIALGGLAIVLIGAVIIILKKKKKKTPPAAPASRNTEPSIKRTEQKNGTEKFDGDAVADSAMSAEGAPVILTKTVTAKPTTQKKTPKIGNGQNAEKTNRRTEAKATPPTKESPSKPAETAADKPDAEKKSTKAAIGQEAEEQSKR